MPKLKEPTVKVSVRLPAHLHKKAKHAATDRDLTLNDYLCLAIARGVPADQRSKANPS